MKTRTGFVSNSSSSSFVLVITKEAHEQAMSTISKYAQAIVEAIGVEELNLGNEEVVMLEVWGSEYPDVECGIETKTERGCDHIVPDSKHCPECGKPAYIEVEEEHYPYEVFHEEYIKALGDGNYVVSEMSDDG